MIESILTFLGIYFLCWFKFIAGPLFGPAAGYSLIETILITIAGMMSSVLLFTLLGKKLKIQLERLFPRRNKTIFSKKSRNIVHLWKKYGEIGIAFITPILLTPIGGTLIMVSFGVKKSKIYAYMLCSACLWAVIFSVSINKILAIPFIAGLHL